MARKATINSKSKTSARKQRPAIQKEPVTPKRQKPVISVGTLFTLVLFAGLLTLAVYLNKNKEATALATPTGQQLSFVFAEDEGSPTSIEIKSASGTEVKLVRNAQNTWALELPQPAEADQGLAEAAATQITSLPVLDEVDADPSIFGFDAPGYVVTVEFTGGKKHILEIGDTTPSNSGYYVRVDSNKMTVVSTSSIDSLLKIVASPPYLNTPTPTTLPASGAPAPEVTVTSVP
ncbi:MAG: DUF4340 domain-containing protein [Chloroflexi bacterium]|nr:DUF4340 domain-containing protein [Chloroflexota bacterium]